MTKTAFALYTPRQNGHRSIEEAISELQREMDTRKRILDNWVNQGRLSWVEAHDRFERHLTALRLLIEYSNALDKAAVVDNNPPPLVSSQLATNKLDAEPAEQAA